MPDKACGACIVHALGHVARYDVVADVVIARKVAARHRQAIELHARECVIGLRIRIPHDEITIDDNALYRHKDLSELRDLNEETPAEIRAFRGPEPANFVDEFVFAKQREMQLIPAAVAPDEVFLRRVYLDVIGVLPSPAEAAAFLDSKDPEKRSKLADQLLAREEYAAHWALKWADVLRGSPVTISERGVHSFHRYLVRTMAEDRPVSDFARELLTGLGNTLNKPAANFLRVARAQGGEKILECWSVGVSECGICFSKFGKRIVSPFCGDAETGIDQQHAEFRSHIQHGLH